ncbi:hypothetical protein CWATWH0005_5684 [Crocosphaera watsonii WH 0005]|uniref:Uncharacterized protein n=1 Tax=Crocosphaera watsonii WH 0005 TaxID=423472 RepID=T2INJ8_CROWT|nr:hypothetical protein CWATWH0005_5684 [Crocosphaera watsonii WH 0005]
MPLSLTKYGAIFECLFLPTLSDFWRRLFMVYLNYENKNRIY